MSGLPTALSAIGSIFGVVKQIIPMLQGWFNLKKEQENREKMEEIVKNPNRAEAASQANDIFRGTSPKKPEPPKTPPASLILVFVLGASLVGCAGQGLRFDPDFCIGDYEKVGCTRENGVFYPANAPAFNKEFCMSDMKALELSKLLQGANGLGKDKASRQYLNELKADARSSEKKQWVDEGSSVNNLWILELRRLYRENRIRNAKLGVDAPDKGEPPLEAVLEDRF